VNIQFGISLFLLVVTSVFFLVQVFFLIRMLRFKPIRRKFEADSGVSVVVCGRNAARNWEKLLPRLFSQNHPDFEVVAVNDRSTDETEEVLENFAKRYPNLKVVRVEDNDRFYIGKKFALTLGIKAAKYDNLVLTDSDCVPDSPNWLVRMAAGFRSAQVVLGYGDYEAEKGLLNSFIRWETLQTALMGFSAASAGRPYMALGRNLAYTKDLFFKRKGFYDHMHIPMGDDDLFVNHAAPYAKITWVAHPEAKTLSIPKTTYKDWWNQKRRHLEASKHYRFASKFMLGLYGMSKAGFFLACIVLLFTEFMFFALGMFVVYMIMLTVASYRFSRFWDLGKIGWYGPWLDLILIHIQGMVMIANFFRWKKPTW
jgi:biofilm PGA synthesis N-glycosyltransferase PgaC